MSHSHDNTKELTSDNILELIAANDELLELEQRRVAGPLRCAGDLLPPSSAERRAIQRAAAVRALEESWGRRRRTSRGSAVRRIVDASRFWRLVCEFESRSEDNFHYICTSEQQHHLQRPDRSVQYEYSKENDGDYQERPIRASTPIDTRTRNPNERDRYLGANPKERGRAGGRPNERDRFGAGHEGDPNKRNRFDAGHEGEDTKATLIRATASTQDTKATPTSATASTQDTKEKSGAAVSTQDTKATPIRATASRKDTTQDTKATPIRATASTQETKSDRFDAGYEGDPNERDILKAGHEGDPKNERGRFDAGHEGDPNARNRIDAGY
eukprot:g1016.t1